jgi:DNA polymerase III delta prime subunit
VALSLLGPGETTTFIFVLHQVSALHPALRSRAQAFRLQPLTDNDPLDHLTAVCEAENFHYEDPALDTILHASRASQVNLFVSCSRLQTLGLLRLHEP